jgi:hypothetical protein
MPGHLYRLKYRLDHHPEGFTKEEAQEAGEEGFGSCDKAVLISIIEPEDGSLSTLFLSKDGNTGEELTEREMFKIWTLYAHRLSQSEELGEGERQLCYEVFEIIRAAILGPRGPAGGPEGVPTA